jgi:hypothetical protein
MYNGVIRALQRLGLADIHGETDIPLYVLNVTYPLSRTSSSSFCAGKEHGAGGRGRPARIHREAARLACSTAPART